MQEFNTKIQARNTKVQAHNTTVQARNTTVQARNTTVQARNTTVQTRNTTVQVILIQIFSDFLKWKALVLFLQVSRHSPSLTLAKRGDSRRFQKS